MFEEWSSKISKDRCGHLLWICESCAQKTFEASKGGTSVLSHLDGDFNLDVVTYLAWLSSK